MKLCNIINTNENLDNPEITPLEASENETELAEDIGSIEEQTRDIDDIDSALDSADDSVGTLSETIDVIGKGEGVPSKIEVATVESLLSSINRSLGLTDTVSSNECYQGISRATLIATLEDKKESIIDKIVAGIRAVINYIIGFIANLFRSKAALGKYIDGLLVRARKLDDSDSRTDEVRSGFSSFESATKAISYNSDLYNTINSFDETLKTFEVMAKSNGGEFPGIDPTDEDAKVERIEQTVQKITDSLPKFGEMQINFRTIKFFGGTDVTFKYAVEGKVNDDGSVSRRIPIVVPVVNYKTDVVTGVRLKKNQIINLLQDVKNSLNELSKLKKIEGIFAAVMKSLPRMGKGGYQFVRAAMLAKKDKGASGKYLASATMRLYSVLARLIASKYTAPFATLAFRNLKAAADYAKASMA